MPAVSDMPPLTILVIDDEVNIRKTLAISLEMDGHRTVVVSNALAQVGDEQEPSALERLICERRGLDHRGGG